MKELLALQTLSVKPVNESSEEAGWTIACSHDCKVETQFLPTSKH
ncbi:hypothetical protein [Levilactobacillus yiduensis]|nr:hypothetical protein [Levilactobacillus yiduensis]